MNQAIHRRQPSASRDPPRTLHENHKLVNSLTAFNIPGERGRERASSPAPSRDLIRATKNAELQSPAFEVDRSVRGRRLGAGAPVWEAAVLRQFHVQQDAARREREERQDEHHRVDVRALLLSGGRGCVRRAW